MEPKRLWARLSDIKDRDGTIPALALLAASALLLASCGSAASRDSEGKDALSSSAESSDPPSVGTYPSYPIDNYAYTLTVSCFCANAGEPIRVTVRNGKVVSTKWVKRGRGHKAGQPTGMTMPTINKIIDAINNRKVAQVDVTWPEGQEYPSAAYIDGSEQIADDEIGYTLSDVIPTGAE
jgi:hypothetical protein